MKGLLGVVKPTLIGQNTLNECRILQADPLITGITVDYRHDLHLQIKDFRLTEVKFVVFLYKLSVPSTVTLHHLCEISARYQQLSLIRGFSQFVIL